MRKLDLIGKKFGRLLVIGEADGRSKASYWLVRCDCGVEKVVSGNNIKRGLTKSCGCTARDWTRTSERRKDKAKEMTERMQKVFDYIGQRFGKLVVVGRTESIRASNSKRVYSAWRVICDCGTQKIVKGVYLTSNGLQSCGCWKGSPLPDGQAAKNQTIARYKYQAQKRGLSWQLTNEEVEMLFTSNCHYCGVSPYTITRGFGDHGDFIFNGVDRRMNEIGYVNSNVVSCCGTCNRMKGTMTYDEFLVHLVRAGDFQREKLNTASLSREQSA